MSETIVVTIIGAILTIITGAVGALWRQMQLQAEQIRKQNEHILGLTTKNAQLETQVADLRDDLNVEREAHKLDNERHERQMQNLVDENRILRSALRAHGIKVEDYSASDTPPGIYGRRRQRQGVD